MFIVGSSKDFIEVPGSAGGHIPAFYQIPVGAKVKVEAKFIDGKYNNTHEAIEVYNSEQKNAWCVELDYSHNKYFVGRFRFRTYVPNEYLTFTPETLEFISKGWVFIDCWNMPEDSNDWIADSAAGASYEYVKVSYEI